MDVIPTGDLMEWMFDFTKPWEVTTDQTVDEPTSGQGDARVLAEAETEMESSSKVEADESDEADEATVLEIPARFQTIGYDSINFIENIGFLFVFILLFAVILTVLASFWLLSLCWDRAHPYYKSLYTSIFWNMPLTFGLEGYIEFAVASFINLHLFHWITISDIFNSVACIAGLALTVSLPPFVLWFLVKNRGKLNQKDNKQKFSSLYEGLEKQNVWGLYFTFLFLVKRLIIAVVVVFL